MDRQNRLPRSFDVPRARSIERTRWGDLTVDLPYRRPYDWPAMASFLRARAIRGIGPTIGGITAIPNRQMREPMAGSRSLGSLKVLAPVPYVPAGYAPVLMAQSASAKMSISPSFSACLYTCCEPGMTTARVLG